LGFTTNDHPYVHPNYNHCGIVSSRTACSNPNLLQFPSRGELKRIKQCLVVDEGRKLIGFDK
jgi:DNA polymerase I-like protein with 3'-5' exonuclease and polymerase domains